MLDEYGYEEEAYDDADDSDYFDENEEPAQLPCPECGKLILEDCSQCPYCGQYIVFDRSLFSGRPAWLAGTVKLIIVLLILALLAPFLLMLQAVLSR